MLFGMLLLFPFSGFAHDSPEHKIGDLSIEIARSGKTAALLMERAIEHRTLGHLADAAADLEAAYALDPKLVEARKELALVQLADGKTELALRTINKACANEASPDFLMARAEIQVARKDYGAALQDCEAAFREPTDNVEWYLLRAQLQRRLGKFKDCLTGLRDGFGKTGSAVLEEEIVDAMIDAGEHNAALKKIERELSESRWRSSWLIRRARVHLLTSAVTKAERDLRAAVVELNSRMTLATPDASLIVDRGIAYALLGDNSRAREDLERARALSADWWTLWRMEQFIAGAGRRDS